MGDMRTVDLDDGAPDDAAPAPVQQRRRRWPWLLAAVVLVVGALATWQRVIDAREHRALAEAADASGVLLPLPEQLRDLWSVPTDLGFGGQVAAVGPHLLAASTSDDGTGYEIHEVDRLTGATGWSVTGSVATAGAGGVDCRPLSPDSAPPTLAACAIGIPLVYGVLPTETSAARLVVLDAATGDVLSTTETSGSAWTTSGDQLVTAVPQNDGDGVTWTLTAVDGPTGAPAWTLTLPTVPVAPPETDENGLATGRMTMSSLAGSPGRVVLADQGHAWVVVDGRLQTSETVPADWSVSLDASGVVEIAPGDGTSSGQMRLVLTDGSTTEAPVQQISVAVDDGSMPGLVLVRAWKGLALQARDATTGAVRWEVPAGGTQVLVMAGRVITRSGDDIAAVDADDGHVVWHTHTVTDSAIQLLTDAHNVYVPVPGRLRAFALSDGTELPDRVLPQEHADETPFNLAGVLALYGTGAGQSVAVVG
ncbi:MAG TPA: hypothetical protein VNR62_09060 [Cellulomonas sp.]|nr:hypothetical protein [Cellulomonas sp.]